MVNKSLSTKRTSLLAVAALTLLVFTPVIMRMITQQAYDYFAHLEIASKMVAAHAILTSHFLLQLGVIALYAILPVSLETAEVVLVMTAYVVTAIIIAKKIEKSTLFPVTASYFSISLLLCAPVTLAFFLDRHLYFGYMAINVFHNPTIILLKPLALLSFGYAISSVTGGKEHTVWSIAACSLVSVACALVKPSFTICLLPALGVYVLVQIFRHEKPDWKLLIIGIILPSLIILAAQYWITYSQSQNEDILLSGKSDIVFAPFAVMRVFSPSWLPLKFVLSILFPVTVLSLNFRAVIKDAGMQFAWLLFAIGAGYTYLLAESGPRFIHGNFGWSGQITLFVLFVQSTIFFLRNSSASGKLALQKVTKQELVCHFVFLLHLLSGIVFYVSEFSNTQKYW